MANVSRLARPTKIEVFPPMSDTTTTDGDASTIDREVIAPSSIAHFYKLDQCSMYLFRQYIDDTLGTIEDVPLSPLYAKAGTEFEHGQLKALLEADVYSVGPDQIEEDTIDTSFDESWSGTSDQQRLVELVDELASGGRDRPIVFFQPTLECTVEAWPICGDADIVLAVPRDDGGERVVEVRVLEIKSSETAKTHHQIQAAVYTLALRELLAGHPVDISATIVTSESGTRLENVVSQTGSIMLGRLPTFELASRENDVRLLLEDGGTLDDVLLYDGSMASSSNDPPFRLDGRCDGCPKQAKCLAYAATNHDLALLGLTEGVQESLREFGIDTLGDLTDLYELPDGDWELSATNYETPTATDPELVARIQRETEISNLLDLVQIAHRFRRELDPQFDDEWDGGPWSEMLLGTGRNLPDDNPYDKDWKTPWEDTKHGYPKGSLVRVYPYVQYDHVRNRVTLLAAKVTCTRYEEEHGDGVFIIARPQSLPQTPSEREAEERRLLESYFDRLGDAIHEVAPDLTDEGENPGEGYVHLYPYSEQQRDALMDAVKRHEDLETSQAIRTLLGYRADIDQEAVSILRSEFRQRHAFRYPGLGLVQTVAQFYSSDREFAWDTHRDSSEESLKTIFGSDFFETAVPYTECGNRILLDFNDGLRVPDDQYLARGESVDGYYPVVGRHAEVLPLEYLYACEEFDVLSPEWADSPEMRERIVQYRHYTDETSPQITLADIEDGVRAVCDAYEYIERCIRDKDAKTPKQPVNVADITENSLGASALQTTCVEYQQLEHGTARRGLENRYRTPLSQRVSSGQAVPFKVTTQPTLGGNGEEPQKVVSGEMLRDLGGDNGDGVRTDTPLSIERGTWVVLTPLTTGSDGTLTEDVEKPQQIANQVLGVVQTADPRSGFVSISIPWDGHRKRKPNMTNHVGWTTDPKEDEKTLITEGAKFVVDEAIDDYAAFRAREALRQARSNDIHNRLLRLYEEHTETALQYETPFCSPDAVDSFLKDFDEVMPFSTNDDQRSFVTRLDHSVAGLQGPPGTGKTTYASTPAILSRVSAFAREGRDFAGVVSAHSNNAVDEIADAVGTAVSNLADRGVCDDLTLVRIRSSESDRSLPENVIDLQYYDDREQWRELYENTMGEEKSEDGEQVLVFATPVTLRNAMNAVADLIDDEAETAEDLFESGGARRFDFALIDEASMLDLPLLFLLGAFLRESRQLLLVGDHRQMQPIQQHDWVSEDRETIEAHTPAVSALDFLRFLRGTAEDTLAHLEREAPDWSDPDDVLPMDRLTTTYRLPQSVAEMETDLFYHKDGIELTSEASAELMPDVRDSSMPEWMHAALDPEARVTLLLHDDDEFTKDSPLEAYLAEQLLDSLPTVSADEEPSSEEVTAGVVVPFRLMRRRLSDELNAPVDTVERFQGDEKDVMVLSMTAGNQGYVNTVSEFLLDANRFNVGASRMKRKLFIVASKSLFRAVSPDVEEYENQKAWKQLYRALGVGERDADANLTVTHQDASELTPGRSVSVEIYNGYRDE